MAQTIILLFKEEYSSGWTNFFEEILSYLQKGSVGFVDMFLRMMETIDECVVSKVINRTTLDVARNTDIKNFMRQRANNNLFEAFYSIINSFYKVNPEITNFCLTVVSSFIGKNLLI